MFAEVPASSPLSACSRPVELRAQLGAEYAACDRTVVDHDFLTVRFCKRRLFARDEVLPPPDGKRR
jgi:hypothetical protein